MIYIMTGTALRIFNWILKIRCQIVNNPKNILIWGDNIKTDMLEKDDFTKGDIFLIDFTTNPLLKNKGGNRGIIDINSTIFW